jgi:hypothetical protein
MMHITEKCRMMFRQVNHNKEGRGKKEEKQVLKEHLIPRKKTSSVNQDKNNKYKESNKCNFNSKSTLAIT